MTQKTFKYRIYPTKHQQTLLSATLEECRWLYNKTLEYRKKTWELNNQTTSLYDTISKISSWKQERPYLSYVHSQILQNVCVRVDLAFKSFFRRVKHGEKPGYPRFKGKGRYDSFTYPQSGFKLEENKLRLSKIGMIQIRLHRPIEGKVKTCTIREINEKWFVCFSCNDVPTNTLPVSDKVIGIDLGLHSFATQSDGKKIDNPRFFRCDEQSLMKVQRRFSVSEKGTAKRAKLKKSVARIHERIRNRRTNFAHQLSRKLINQYGVIAFEDLNIQQMLQNGSRGLNKSISDAAWRQLIQYSMYKAEDAGRRVILVDPRNTSKMCSRCGKLVEKELSDRLHVCPMCGLEIDRDTNAAINILRLGLQSHPKSP
jgi:putative transposase